jgi:hypothetical protein
MFSSAMGGSSHSKPLAEAQFENFLCLHVKDYCDIYLNKQNRGADV